MSDDDAKVQQLMSLTGVDVAAAKAMLTAASGDLDDAITLHFEAEGQPGGGGVSSSAAATPAAAAKPALPSESETDIVNTVLDNARQEAPGDASAAAWSGRGQALGGPPDTASASSADGAETAAGSSGGAGEGSGMLPPLDRHNAKKIRVIFWADGFTVEDTTAEEEEAAAAAKAEAAAPRRTGLATLSGEKTRTPAGAMPKIPELRRYEDNAEFMRDLKASIPPVEFREVDLSTGVPRPRPVDIMLGDMRPQAYPADALKRQLAMGQPPAARAPPKTTTVAFSGEGRTLGASPAAVPAAPAGTAGGGGEGEWPYAARAASVVVADGAPSTDVQVRLPGGPPQRFRLDRTSHTVADLKALVEQSLAERGEAPRAYALSAGFPPKPLTDDGATIDAAGLAGAAVTHRWA